MKFDKEYAAAYVAARERLLADSGINYHFNHPLPQDRLIKTINFALKAIPNFELDLANHALLYAKLGLVFDAITYAFDEGFFCKFADKEIKELTLKEIIMSRRDTVEPLLEALTSLLGAFKPIEQRYPLETTSDAKLPNEISGLLDRVKNAFMFIKGLNESIKHCATAYLPEMTRHPEVASELVTVLGRKAS